MAEQEEIIPSVLLPCNSCGRTFRPDALSKHAKYCEKSLIKKRKVFDSAKQRIQGTDLAEFLPVVTQKKKCDKSPIRKTQSKWKEKHMEFVRAIRAAKGGPSSDSSLPAAPLKPVDHEKCLYCDRYFGPKAYDRHLEWCKEHHSNRNRPKSPASIQARERLEARTKYKAPMLNRTRRASISEKCSTKSCTRDPSPAERLTRTRSSSLSSRTISSISREAPSNVSPKNNTALDSFKRNQPARNSRRSVSPMKKAASDITKNKAVTNNVNQNNRSRGRQVSQQVLKSEAKKETNTTPNMVKGDIFSASCNISTINPGHNQKHKIRTPAHNSGSNSHRIAIQNSPPKCMLNTILVSQEVKGMTVQQCCLKSYIESDELAEKYYKVGEESEYLKVHQSSLKKSSTPNKIYDSELRPKQDLLISKDIVHFTGKSNQALMIEHFQADNPGPTVCDNSAPDIYHSDLSIKKLCIANNIEDKPRNHGTNLPDGQKLKSSSTIPVKQCPNIGNVSVLDSNISTNNVEIVDVSSIDSNLMTAGLIVNSFRDLEETDNALEYHRNCDELIGVESDENSFFSNEDHKPLLNTEMLCSSSDKPDPNKLIPYNKLEVYANLSVNNEAKISSCLQNVYFSNVEIDCKENLCFDCQKCKSDSDLLLYDRKDLFKCCIKRRERLFEVKKSLCSDHAMDASVRYSQKSMLENEHHEIDESEYIDSGQSLTEYKSCMSIDEKCCRIDCSHKESRIEETLPISNHNEVDKSTSNLVRDNSDFPWSNTHEILSPCRKLTSGSINVIEDSVQVGIDNKNQDCVGDGTFSPDSKQTFGNADWSDKVTVIDEISFQNDKVIDETGFQINCSNGSPHESTDEILSPSRRLSSGSINLIEDSVQIEFDNKNQDYVGDETFSVENDDNLFEKSQGDIQHSLDENVGCHWNYAYCGNIQSSDSIEIPEIEFINNNEHLNTVTNEIHQKENIDSVDNKLETNECSIENIESNRGFKSMMGNHEILKQDSSTEEVYGPVFEIDVDAIGNIEEACEVEQYEVIGRLNKRRKSRNVECFELKISSIQDSDSLLNSRKKLLDSFEIVDPCVSVGEECTNKLQSTSSNRKSSLRKKFKSKIPFRTDCKISSDFASLESKTKKPPGNKNCVGCETLKSRFPLIGKSSSPTEIESMSNNGMSSPKHPESDSCAVLYYNTHVDQLWKINNVNSDLGGLESANSRSKTFTLPPIKESSSFESSNSLNMKRNESKIDIYERNEVIEPKVLRKRHLPKIKKTSNRESNVVGGREKKKTGKSMENYDPYKSAERQMKELLGLSDDDDALVHSLVPQPPPVLNSLNSAFAKFSPIQSKKDPDYNFNRSPDSDLDNDFERLEAEAESRITPTLADRGGIVDKNFNPMSLSTISLCSTISIQSFDNSRNSLRKGISSSAKVQSCDRKAQLPLQRSVSVVETPRRGRDFLKSNLKMEHLLFGVTGNNYNFNDNSLGCDVGDSSSDNKNLKSSNELLKNSNSSLASQAEQDLLKSVSEFEKLFATPSSLNPYSPLIPNSSPATTLTPLDHIDKHRSQANKFITDSAYNSLNRKSPQQESPVDVDNCSTGSSECSSTRGKAAQSANFCHECGAKFPVLAAKFCCNCGVRRLVI